MEVEVHITSQFLHVIIHWKYLIKKKEKNLKKVNNRLPSINMNMVSQSL